jgi:hypothetical protein
MTWAWPRSRGWSGFACRPWDSTRRSRACTRRWRRSRRSSSRSWPRPGCRRDQSVEPTAQDRHRAHNAFRLLSSWTGIPGSQPDGGFDGAALHQWVHEVLPLLDTAELREAGEEYIGMALAAAPADPDGAWPCRPVRELLEELQLPHVERAMKRQLYNRRGTTSRDPEAGGDLERKLAARYREQAQAFVDRWPRTAAILRRYADDLEADARRYDHEAERRRKGLDP